MFTKLRIRNFKAWKDTGEIRLAPLTVIFGRNSAGKSSLGHLLLALRQTAASTDRRRALHTGDETSLVDLGSFVETLHGRDPSSRLEFELEWSLPERLRIADPVEPGQDVSGSSLRLSCALAAADQGQPSVRELRYALRDEGRTTLSATLSQTSSGVVGLEVAPYRLVAAAGHDWLLEPPEKFYRVSSRSLARYRNADFLSLFALEVERRLAGLSYLGPLRERPHRSYAWYGHAPEDVGARGEHAIACLLAADAAGRTLGRGRRTKPRPFGEFVARAMVDLGVLERFRVSPPSPGRREHEVRVTTPGGRTEVALPDVGFGVSQVLPALVQAFYCPAGSTVWMEQPELHLHPEVQSELADVFISAIGSMENGRPRCVQLVVETHSEHFLHRLQRRIAEEAISPDDVAIHFVERGARGSSVEELRVDAYGEISNWPEHFFGDEMGEMFARAEASARRRTGRAR